MWFWGRQWALKLSSQYNIDLGCIRVISNSGFIEDEYLSERPAVEVNLPVTIGFLSNITAEKGIFLFFDALRALREEGLCFRAVIAGPVSPIIADRFSCELDNAPEATYLGGVYGASKALFFQNIDLLLFPTIYQNEAEPVTIMGGDEFRCSCNCIATWLYQRYAFRRWWLCS